MGHAWIARTPTNGPITMVLGRRQQPTSKRTEKKVYALGPNHGPLLYRLVAIPRSSAGQISAMVPPALLRGDAPQTPARNRNRMRTVEFGARAQGI